MKAVAAYATQKGIIPRGVLALSRVALRKKQEMYLKKLI